MAEVVIGLLLLEWGLFQNFAKLGVANVLPDERGYFDAAWAYVHGAFDVNLEHPFTAKLIMGAVQGLLGHEIINDRIATATASMVTALILWWWLRWDAGRVTGLVAAALWMLLPRSVGLFALRADRYGLLEPFMVLFGVAAIAACRWWCRSGRTGAALCCGVMLGLAVSSKVPMAVVLPALLAAPFLSRRDRPEARDLPDAGSSRARWGGWARWDRRTGWQAAGFLAVSGLVLLASYLPSGNALEAVRSMIAFQARHDLGGHLVLVAGRVVKDQPWWTNLYWMIQNIGRPAAVAYGVGLLALIGCRFRPRGPAVLTAVCLALLMVFLLFVSRVALEHYYVAFIPGLTILAALGIGQAFTLAAAKERATRVVLRAVALLAVLAAAISANTLTGQTARLAPWGAQLAAEIITREHAVGPVVITGIKPEFYDPYFSVAERTFDPAAVAIVVQHSDPLSPMRPSILHQLHVHADQFRRVQAAPDLQIYIRIKPARVPARR